MKKKDLNRSENEEQALNSFILDKYLGIKSETDPILSQIGCQKPKDLYSKTYI
jgi:hypothetical protein